MTRVASPVQIRTVRYDLGSPPTPVPLQSVTRAGPVFLFRPNYFKFNYISVPFTRRREQYRTTFPLQVRGFDLRTLLCEIDLTTRTVFGVGRCSCSKSVLIIPKLETLFKEKKKYETDYSI